MARATITKTQSPGKNPAAGVVVTWTDCDPSNHNQFLMSGDDLLLVRNAHADTAKTFTLNSVADAQGRTGDITAESLAAGAVRVLGPFEDKTGWMQSNGYCYLTGESTDIKFAVIKLKPA